MLLVIVRPTLFDLVPPYLRSETLFETQGNLPASVSLDVQRVASIHRRRTVQRVAGALVIAARLGIAAYSSWPDGDAASRTAGTVIPGESAPSADAAATRPATTGTVAAKIAGTDGAPGVLVPAGEFIMGDDESSPRREIYVNSSYFDQHEVTLARFGKFLKATSAKEMPL